MFSVHRCYFLPPSFLIFLNTQQLAGRKHAEWGLIVILELHVSFVTVTANLPRVQRRNRKQEGELSLITWNLSQSSVRDLPLLPLGCRVACSDHLLVNFYLQTQSLDKKRCPPLEGPHHLSVPSKTVSYHC